MESLHYLFMKTNAVFSRRVLGEVSKIGLTAGQPKVLDFLSGCPEADQKTIAARCEIEPATVGSILLRMEKAGLILRRQREGNRRSLYVYLTDKGRAAARSVEEIFRRAEAPVAEALTGEELEQLKSLLARTCAALEGKTEEGGGSRG